MLKQQIKTNIFYYLALAISFGLILVQLFLLQIINGSKYNEISEKNYIRIRRINPNRGMILDEKLRPLAYNRPSINLYFTPYLINDRQSFLTFISEQLDITKERVEKMIYDNRFRTFEEILIHEDLQVDQLAHIAEMMNYYPELSLKAEIQRHYSFPNHYIGYIAKISENEFKQYRNSDYTLNSKIGKIGIEKYYEGLLCGQSGYEILQVDASGRNLNLFKNDLNKKPVHGFNVVLTINLELQEFIHTIFPRDKAGAVVVLNTRTGGILSYNSFPEYDQNWFTEGLSQMQWDYLNDHEQKPLIDRVVNGAYSPGSTYKIISASFGLEKNYISEHTLLTSCRGGLQIGNRYFKCWDEKGHGRSAVNKGIMHSCDVYFYDLSAKFALDEFSEFSYNNYLHTKTGIDLPTERFGFSPNTDWYKSRLGSHFSTTGLKANLVIGQGEILVTPLSMASYYCALANDGLWQTPHLFKEAFNENEVVNYTFFEKTNKKLPVSENTLNILQKALFDTVNAPGGTAWRAKVSGVDVYAKTGSTENPQGELTHASMAGFARWNDQAEIAFYIIVENAGGGGAIAGPIANQIINFYQSNIR
ncbi:MAG: penicillin-binding protein 2 [Candidatus Cloacimonetes bacterium]|nr:penicillin-binding protein 2 [Candidatus Cloacimonadota bacterium]